MQMKQPAWESMPVLDVRAFSSKQLTTLEALYDSLSREELQPLARLKTDSVRCEIDAGISRALNIPELAFIRELLEREPGLTAKDIAPRHLITDGEEEEKEMAEPLF